MIQNYKKKNNFLIFNFYKWLIHENINIKLAFFLLIFSFFAAIFTFLSFFIADEFVKKIVKIIREFLKINCSIGKLEKTLKSFVKKNNLNNRVFKDLSTIKNLSKINSKTIFSANFGRDIEYYTGIVFEIYNSSKKEIARGGRYDGLLKSLGSKKNISAVGAAINLNNLKT